MAPKTPEPKKKVKVKVKAEYTCCQMILDRLAGGAKMTPRHIVDATPPAAVKQWSPNGKTPQNTIDRQRQVMVKEGVLKRERMLNETTGKMAFHYYLD